MLDRPKRSTKRVNYSETAQRSKKVKPSSVHGNDHPVQDVILQQGNNFIMARTQKNLSTESISLEDVSDVPEQTMINVDQYDGKKIYGLDVGSSFIKACCISLSSRNKDCTMNTLKFFNDGIEYLPNENWRNLKTGEIRTGFLSAEDPSEWEKIENLKKVFMVSELLEIELKSGTKLRVASIISKVTENLLKALVTTRGRRQKSTFPGLGALIFTCPTGTNENTKKVYRKCINLAHFNITGKNIGLDNIYVIEEAPLLKYFANLTLDSGRVVLFVDIGHLTLDMIIMEKKCDENVITYKNSETGGMSLLQDAFEKIGLNYHETMAELFNDSDMEDLPDYLAEHDGVIREGFERITQPIAMIIVQRGISNIHFTGAVTKLNYFSKLLEKMISQERLQQVMEKIQPYLKEEYLDLKIPHCNYLAGCTGKSALLTGINNMLELALKKPKEQAKGVDIVIKDNSSNIENIERYVPAFLLDVEDSNEQLRKEIFLKNSLLDAFVKQDTELFLLKFSPLIDISKVESITIDNYKDLGITEFIRFTTLIMCFDPKLNLFAPYYILHLDLETDYLVATFFMRRLKPYSKMVTKIERSGRLEKVPINDADRIFTTAENDTTSWYGVFCETRFVITASTLTNIKTTELNDLIGEELGSELIDLMPNSVALEELEKGDNEYVEKLVEGCVVCGRNQGKSEKRVLITTLEEYRAIFNDQEITTGSICNTCSCKFYKKK